MNVKQLLLTANNALLFLCVSMYLGTGWSLVLFSFPVAPQLTIHNYYMQFVPQVTSATHFFTYMTTLMIVLAVVMLAAEWRSVTRWAPIVVLGSVIVATLMTIWVILPLNDEMSRGITSPSRLRAVLDQWMALNRVRVGLWTVQWASMMAYFVYQILGKGTVRDAAVGRRTVQRLEGDLRVNRA
jgi:hypothetical protein